MALASTAKPAARKRNRKRKRRNISSSSSSDSESSSSSDSAPETTAKLWVQDTGKKTTKRPVDKEGNSSEEEHSSESSSSSSENSDVEMTTARPLEATAPRPAARVEPSTTPAPETATKARARAESPPPVLNVPAPTFLPVNDEQALKDRFRKFWMSSIADAFADDLNVIRNEPNLAQSRLTLLIDSLASGADVYSSSSAPDGKRTNEMEVILGDS